MLFSEYQIFGAREIYIRSLNSEDLNQPEKFKEYINSLIDDPDAVVSFKKRRTLNDEIFWLKNTIKQISEHKNVTLLAEDKNKIIGMGGIALQEERREHVALMGLSIIKGYRGIGLGSYLMEKLVDLAKTELEPQPKIIRISTLSINKKGIEFYKKHGFDIVGIIPDQFEYGSELVDEVIMLKYI